MRGVITIPFDPVLHLGPLPIHWYGLGYAVAFLVGFRLVVPFLAARGVTEKDSNDLVWINIGIGLLGARLYYDIQQPNFRDFLSHPLRLIAVWEGGMAFFGALIACLLTVVVFAYRRRLSIWLLLDAGALFATLPQAIGRIGNIINGDILGAPSRLPWAVRYTSPNTFAPHGDPSIAYQPANAYELLAALLLFGIVLLVLRARPRHGTAGIVYVAGYAVSQFLVFFLRATEPTILGGLKQAQLTAVVILVVVVPLLLVLRQRFPGAWAPRAVAEPAPIREDG
jgi:phosphatidylglycerol:prolipoprotein diacylglycerol transferase